MTSVILLSVLINLTMLKAYYTVKEKKTIKESYYQIQKVFQKDTVRKNDVDEIAKTYNYRVLISDGSGTIVYSSEGEKSLMYKSLWNILNENLDKISNQIKKQGYAVMTNTNKSMGTSINLMGYLDGDYTVIISTPMESIQTSARLSGQFTMYVGLILIICGAVAMYLYSRQFTKPIEDMAKAANQMSHLDFDVKVPTGSDDELGRLGASINELSSKLEFTISELKTANNELQKDIEQKVQIDEMRKEFLSHVSHELKTPIALIQGYSEGLKDIVSTTEDARVLKYKNAPVEGKVGIVTGGGSGHKPAFIGYIGENLCDAVAVGEIFSSPTAKAFLDAIKEADSGKGVACLYGNYAGDNMNVKMAMRKAKKLGIEVKTVVANDDCASAPKTELEKRRGVAGEVLMWKVGGAKASMGGSLDEVIAVAQKAIDNTRSVGIGTAPCTIPAVGHPNFQIEDGTMEVGIGHHGEPGINVQPLKTADDIAEEMLDIIIPDLPFESGDEVVVLLSGLGATPVMEQYIVYNRVEEILTEKGIKVYRSYVGNYFTSLEMMGVTLTVMKLDDELKECIDMPANSVGLKQF